jgi:hypothetical protein
VRDRGWERWAGIAGIAYVLLYVGAFALGIEVGDTDAEIREHYADSGARTKEVAAFFLIAGAALSFLVFAAGIRVVIAWLGPTTSALAALGWAGAIGYAALVLAANAVSRAAAFASMSDDFELDLETRDYFETVGFLLFVSGTYAAILLVAAVAIAALRHGALPRWLGWVSVVVAPSLILAIGFIGFLFLFVWVLVVSVVLIRRPAAST